MEHFDEASDVPGTVVLEQVVSSKSQTILHPVPSNDPNDPLNWSLTRKNINFGLCCSFVTFTFVLLTNIGVAYEPYSQDLGVTYEIYNQAVAANYAGLAIGSIFFIPFVHRYGRRPLYLASTLVQLATAIWGVYMQSSGEVIAMSLVSGLGGALSETIVLVTIGDMYFLHQHALLNGLFLLMQSVGAFVGPAAMGYAVQYLGWRWMWKITAILIGSNLAASIVLFEESKYIPQYNGQPVSASETQVSNQSPIDSIDKKALERNLSFVATETEVHYEARSYRQRMALITPTDEPVIRHFYQPFLILFTIPGVAYAAITYGTMLAWMAVMATSISFFTLLPPWNLQPNQVGLLSLAPFVGLFIGSVLFSPLSDRSIIMLSKRNKGVFEPEMRLWLALGGALLCFAGCLVYGYCIGRGLPLMTFLVGSAIYGVGFVICADVSLTYVLDCYQNIIGDAMVVIVFCRNIISVIMLFIYTPWVSNLGLEHTFLIISILCLVTLLGIPIILLIYGKRLRISSVAKYRHFSGRQTVLRRQ